MTRDELIETVRVRPRVVGECSRYSISREMSHRAVDVVLDEVLRLTRGPLENDWNGRDFIHELYKLRGGRP